MAKESMKARERKRERMVARYAKKREQLTKVLKSTSTDEDVVNQKWDAMMAYKRFLRIHLKLDYTTVVV